jgi:hypothetical protein
LDLNIFVLFSYSYTYEDSPQNILFFDSLSGKEARKVCRVLKRSLLFSHTRNYFWNGTVTDALPLGEIAAQALPHHSEALELTQNLIDSFNAEGTKITPNILSQECGYINDNDNWFKPTEIQHFNPSLFYLPDLITDPFGNETEIEYDSYNLFPVKVTDALGF